MIGIFTVDKSRRKEYRRLKRNRTIIIHTFSVIILIVFSILSIKLHTKLDSEILTILILGSLSGYILLVIITFLIGAKDIFDKMVLEITKTGVIGQVGMCRKTKILFNEIDCVQVYYNGIFIIRKGFWNKLIYKHLRLFTNAGTNNNLIYIPCKIERFDEIKKFLVDLSDAEGYSNRSQEWLNKQEGVKIACPGCGRSRVVKKYGNFKCAVCETKFSFGKDGIVVVE